MDDTKWITTCQTVAAQSRQGLTEEQKRWASTVRSRRRAGTLSDEKVKALDTAFEAEGLTFNWEKQKPGPRPSVQRDSEIKTMRANGASLREIGDSLYISRQRVFQILNR
jgi:hypothetical protein